MKKNIIVFFVMILLFTGCNKEKINYFEKQINHEKIDKENKLYECSKTTDREGILFKEDKTIELDSDNKLVKFGIINSYYNEEYFKYNCQVMNEEKERNKNKRGYYYYINCDKKNNLVSGGQFYIVNELHKKRYNVYGLTKYKNDKDIFNVKMWMNEQKKSGFLCQKL